MKQQTQTKRHKQLPAEHSSPRLALVTLSIMALLMLWLSAGVAGASTPKVGASHNRAIAAAQATTTTVITGAQHVPSPVQSATAATIAGPVATVAGQTVEPRSPKPVGTEIIAITPAVITSTLGVADVPITPRAATGSTGQNVSPPGTTSAGSFPWLPVGLLSAVALAGLAFLLSRSRRATTVTTGAPTIPVKAEPREALSTVTTTATSTTAIAGGAAAPVSALQCPNCGTANSAGESFCRECGQDLRPLRAPQVVPTTTSAATSSPTPVMDEVDDTTPYVETLNRVDEQLEYVLARPQIAIGTAAGNDIVVDSMFHGWQTVSPMHAELRREQQTFVVIDKGSEGGTFLNGERVTNSVLSDGDRVGVGDVQFVFRVPTESTE